MVGWAVISVLSGRHGRGRPLSSPRADRRCRRDTGEIPSPPSPPLPSLSLRGTAVCRFGASRTGIEKAKECFVHWPHVPSFRVGNPRGGLSMYQVDGSITRRSCERDKCCGTRATGIRKRWQRQRREKMARSGLGADREAKSALLWCWVARGIRFLVVATVLLERAIESFSTAQTLTDAQTPRSLGGHIVRFNEGPSVEERPRFGSLQR